MEMKDARLEAINVLFLILINDSCLFRFILISIKRDSVVLGS